MSRRLGRACRELDAWAADLRRMTGPQAKWWAMALYALSHYEGREFVVADSPAEMEADEAVHALLRGEEDDPC